MSPVGFKPTISAGERPQTYALDRAATGTGNAAVYYTFHDFVGLKMTCVGQNMLLLSKIITTQISCVEVI